LGEDEAWLLQLGCVLQRRHFSEAAAILGNWLPPAALRIAVAPAERFAVGLAASGLHLPCRHAEAATVRLLAPEAHAARGLTLVQSNDETRAIPDRAAAAPTPYRHDIAAEIPPSAGGRCCRTRATSEGDDLKLQINRNFHRLPRGGQRMVRAGCAALADAGDVDKAAGFTGGRQPAALA
jgi:hypothetical protein